MVASRVEFERALVQGMTFRAGDCTLLWECGFWAGTVMRWQWHRSTNYWPMGEALPAILWAASFMPIETPAKTKGEPLQRCHNDRN